MEANDWDQKIEASPPPNIFKSILKVLKSDQTDYLRRVSWESGNFRRPRRA